MAKKILYSKVGDNYEIKDPIKKLAQESAKKTSQNLIPYGFLELSDSRGESAFVWKQGSVLMASVIEGLGTKNLIADEVRKTTHKSYYDRIAQDTVATIINDLSSVGASPLVLNAFWAIGNINWLNDERMRDLILGWKKACDLAGVTWGGGETPTLQNVVDTDAIVLGGSAVGIIGSQKRLLTDKKLREGDRIILLKSTGVNTNGLSLVRAVAKRLPKGYATKMPNGEIFGEAVLNRSNIYAKLIKDLLDQNINLHYASHITGHGFRKIMRGRPEFTYIIERIFEPFPVFDFIQTYANLTYEEMYGTFNMGNDYALFVSPKDVKKVLSIISKNKFKGLDAGYIEKGERKVVLESKDIIFESSSLDLR